MKTLLVLVDDKTRFFCDTFSLVSYGCLYIDDPLFFFRCCSASFAPNPGFFPSSASPIFQFSKVLLKMSFQRQWQKMQLKALRSCNISGRNFSPIKLPTILKTRASIADENLFSSLIWNANLLFEWEWDFLIVVYGFFKIGPFWTL